MDFYDFLDESDTDEEKPPLVPVKKDVRCVIM